MHEALAIVKREMGPDAVILGTRSLDRGGLGRLVGGQRVEITAAPADEAPVAPRVAGLKSASRDGMPSGLTGDARTHYTKLIQSAVAADIAERIVRRAQSATRRDGNDGAIASMKRLIAAMIPACEDIDGGAGGSRRVALVGPAGVGKTTTLAKLAAHHKLRRNREVAIISTDCYRVGAPLQIERYAEIIGAPSAVVTTPRALKAALYRFADSDLILIDTPGAGPRDEARFTHMRELLATAAPDEIHLALPGSMSLDAQLQTVRAFAPLQPTHVALTKLDEAVGFGVVLNTIDQLHLRLSYLTSGQGIPDDLIHACGERVAELVLP